MEYIASWFQYVLRYLGLFNKEGQLVFLGLDNAGKTTLMGALSTGFVKQSVPTHHATKASFTIGKIDFSCFDVGGQIEVRELWKNYFPIVSGIIFIVDSRERLDEAKEALDGVLQDSNIQSVPILILGNKIDDPRAMSEDSLKFKLGVTSQLTGKQASAKDLKEKKIRPMELFMCSVINKMGYKQGFEWLGNYI